jgi:hypothetical protein
VELEVVPKLPEVQRGRQVQTKQVQQVFNLPVVSQAFYREPVTRSVKVAVAVAATSAVVAVVTTRAAAAGRVISRA